ncbi:hypothetical protein CAPTEDRAFT_214950 [Capitella teleta]|uniref:Uncharacterized protein n=1 Tax=Capitella teleta TaxID=283909 RepID=R7VGI3_CAPTE|nr:hypothetical protein CAPTEDRAFT_214950 [Capitella teleta]|eukprot:ELU17963.1 hypothetical protein CAPTEDRAFT_214950 [Capitella teleta]
MAKINNLITLVSPAEAAEVVEDFLLKPAESVKGLRDLDNCLKLDVQLRRNWYTAYMASLGCSTAADAMCRMMTKFASAAVWSQFSLFEAHQTHNRTVTQEAIESTLVDCLKSGLGMRPKKHEGEGCKDRGKSPGSHRAPCHKSSALTATTHDTQSPLLQSHPELGIKEIRPQYATIVACSSHE